jgi:TonB-dependent receptor
VVNNAPSNSNQLVGVPNDSRYHFGDDEYKRFNVQGVIEFKPTDSLTLTADALYANNIEREQRSDTSNWFTRPFDVVTFDGNPTIDTTTYLHETLNGPKDEDYEQQYRAQKNKLQDYGLNLQWNVTNNFTFTLDGHYGKSSVTPDLPNGTTSTLVGLGANVVDAHDVDYSGDIPVEHIVFDDSRSPAADGVLDVGDIGSSVGRTFTNSVYQRVKEIRGDFGWDVGGGNRIDFGALYRSVRTEQDSASTQQILGNWSVDHPGDVERVAPGIIHEFCLMCRFHDFNPQATGVDAISFRGNAIDLYNALSSYYGGSLNPFSGVNTDKEDVYAAYVQSTWKFHLGGMDAGLVAGVRYEHTRERAETFQVVPNAIVWNADNDFTVTNGTDPVAVYGKGGYHNFLPSIDFQLHMTNNLIGRLSYSRTMARPNYNLLFPSTTVTGGPGRPTVLGGFPTGQEGNTALLPLVSDNIDASLEWYFKRDSYVSVGAFYKRVKDFIGTGQTTGPLFGLRDPTSAAAGTRSGVAKNALTGIGADITDVNLFTMTALLQKYNGNVASATADYTAPGHSDPVTRAVNYDYGNTILSQYDILGDSTDPLYQFAISRPINSKDADLYGVEVAGQYFLGNTGFGVSGSFTYVDGNVSFDNGAPTNIDQFALTGLSNTANATLIYDKNGLSARVAWNWRDKFLSATNRDAFHNPVYTAPYSTLDFNFSYDITPHWGISVEALNLTNESLRTYGRDESNVWFAQELQRRFLFGARYKF